MTNDATPPPSPAQRWYPVMPVPEDAPEAPKAHPLRGRPKGVYTFRDAAGQLLGYVFRYIRSTGVEIDVPLTYCSQGNRHDWRWIAFPAKRPLYLHETLGPPDPLRPVVVHFDLRAADVGASVFPDFDHVAFPATLRKMGEVDWAQLRDRTVIIWPTVTGATYRVEPTDPLFGTLLPEAEQPAMKRALWLRDELRAYRCLPILLEVPAANGDLPPGWDAGTAFDVHGQSPEQLRAWFDRLYTRAAKPAPVLGTAPQPDPEVRDEDWFRQLLRKDGTGVVLPELANVQLVLRNHKDWADVIYLDDFAHRMMLKRPPPFEGGDAGPWRDVYDAMTASWMAQRMGMLKLRISDIQRAVQVVGELRKVNPLQDWLRSLQWDGTPRLEEWLITYLGAGHREAPDDSNAIAAAKANMNAYLRISGRIWLCGAVARALSPGCKFDYVLILEGAQGLGKSSAIATLGAPWVLDSPVSLSDKEGMGLIQGKWMVEIPELDSFNRVESTTAKGFFSRAVDRFRMPYGTGWEDYPRSCVFAGTTNEGEYFKDTTGNRRYLPVRCRAAGFDIEALKRDRDQLLAEAVQAVLAGARIYPTPEEMELLKPEQAKREIIDPWEARIAWWLEGDDSHDGQGMRREPPERVTMRELLGEALKVEVSRQDKQSMSTRVGTIMRRLGWVKREDKTIPDRFYYRRPFIPEKKSEPAL